MARDKVIYVSGKYTGNPDQIKENIAVARSYSMRIWELGFIALCPHLNTMHFERDCGCDYEDYMDGDMVLVERSDAMFMIPGWKDSKGACRERAYMIQLEKPVFTKLKTLEHWMK